MSEYGLRTEANPHRELTQEFNGTTYYRYPIRVPMVQIGDSYIELIKTYAAPEFKPGEDIFIVLSEKVISICQKRVIHQSEVEPTWLAKLICRFVTKYPNDVGFENPRKMQVAINQAGYLRMIAAIVIGGIAKFVFGKRGLFYSIAGNGVAEIDGFNPIAVAPFNEYAILGPAEPDATMDHIEKETGIPAIVVDASNVGFKILGRSSGVKISNTDVIAIMKGNPMGQGKEQTPIILVTTHSR
jgi:hypothetical protein